MRVINMLKPVLLICLILLLPGCGGGGGGTGSTATNNEPPAPKTTATLFFSTQGTLPSEVTSVGGATFTITLPDGVSAKTDTNGNVTDFVASGVTAGTNPAILIVPDSANKQKMTVTCTINGNLGEFLKASFTLASGKEPAVTDFQITNITVTGRPAYDAIPAKDVALVHALALQ